MSATSSGEDRAGRLQGTLGALASPVRREILWLTRDRELAAGTIAAQFALAAPTISEHLRVLRAAGLVQMRQVGTSRLYRADLPALQAIRPLLQDGDSKWIPREELPERALARSHTGSAVIVSVEVPLSIEEAFAAFATGERFGRWLGVPVSIGADGRFACTLEWGTVVRGRYELVVPPDLIALRWDFDDHAVPVPGSEHPGYVRLRRAGTRTSVEVQQLVDTTTQARFMDAAWRTVLGRFAEWAEARRG